MNFLQIVLLVAVALAGWPVGIFIASRTKEELQAGRPIFKIICLVALTAILAAIAFVRKLDTLTTLLATFIFIFLLAAAALRKKSRRKK